MKTTTIIFCMISVLFILEIIIFLLVQWLKKDFQWIITSEDESVIFKNDKLINFIRHGYDPILGWSRKAVTSKVEDIKGVGEYRNNYKKSKYSINEFGARNNPSNEEKNIKIITFGDSFAFCRHVDDNQTWQWYLSKSTDTNVVNFGVGNYGIDQSLMKMNMEIDNYIGKADIAVMMSVPETITRIVNVWKHYSEYGNAFGFKGRYFIADNKLKWFDNVINNEGKFDNVDDYIDSIKVVDYCYKNKFKKDQVRFPYFFSLLKNHKRNLYLIVYLLLRKFLLKFNIYNERLLNKAWETVLKRNNDFSVSLYSNSEITSLLKMIILQFSKDAELKGIKPVFVMVPYLHDLFNTKNNKENYYRKVIEDVKPKLIVIDMFDDFSNYSPQEDLYVNSFYGAHLSKVGNEIVAKRIYSELTKRDLLSSSC